MWTQARINRKIARPTPAVPNTSYVITRSLTAMTTADISLCVQQVCSTWRARSRSTNSRNALRGTCVAAQIFLHTSTVAIPWRPTHPLHSRNYSKTRPPTLNSVIFFLYIWPVIPLLFNYSFSVFLSGLMDYKYIYNQHQISIQKAIQ